MKIGLILSLFLVTFGIDGLSQDQKELRNQLFVLKLNLDEISSFLVKLEAIESPTAETVAYTGATCAYLAKLTSNPFKKIHYLNRSKRYLNHAVDMDPKNIEIRFMRFLTQSQVPGIFNLGYDVRSDKTYIVNHLDSLQLDGMTKKMAEFLSGFLYESRYCTLDEAEMLSTHLYTIN